MNKLVFKNQKFYFIGDLCLRDNIKKAGFKWDAILKLWFTEDKFKALLLSDQLNLEWFPFEEVCKVLMPLSLKRAISRSKNGVGYTITKGLKNFQISSVSHMVVEKQNFLLADEQGLGKTIQCAAVINQMKPKTTVIICPATVKLNWKKELNQWLNFKPNLNVITGKNTYFHHDPLSHNVHILNYDILSEGNLAQLRLIEPDLLILDEEHYLKNRDSQRTKKILLDKDALVKSCKKVIALTGTPITKNPVDIWPLCKAICPESIAPYSNYWDFAHQFCRVIDKPFGKEIVGSKNEEELGLRLRSTFMIRREKKDVLEELPPKQYQVITLAQNKQTKEVIKKEAGLPKDEIELAIKKQELKPVGHMATIRKELGIAKVDQCIDFIKDELESVDKIVIFAWHKEVIEKLYSAFANIKGMEYPAVIIGDTVLNERQLAIHRFQNNKNCRLFIGNIQAAGVAITLTAASRVIFVESSWLPSDIDQAIDRCHRIGQNDHVLAQFLVVEESIDAKVLETVVSRMKNINKIL